jgi:hypothetical protein
MFAAWIPEALRAIEALGDGPPVAVPLSSAITMARQHVVNQPDGKTMPQISKWGNGDNVGIELRWNDESIRIGPGGRFVIISEND